jgi:2-polyprenyl-6-methoxyphenol hydroxylase-like FAD-dependent oxidoreductase
MAPSTRAVVLGASMAGTLAASVLAHHVDDVTLIDRDPIPPGPTPRRGVPQARHAHLLWSGGARVIDTLVPGTIQAWSAAGAHHVGLPDGLVSLTAQGWLRRWPRMQYLICCSRDLLDFVVRQRVLTQQPNITTRPGTRAVRLLGDRSRITGVEVRDETTGATDQLSADFVVDATGRGSQTPQWLAQLGLPTVHEEIIDSGLAYATRIFQAPPDAVRDFPVVNVQANPRDPRPGQTATLLPIEDGKWLVTLSGTRGGEPGLDDDAFIPFARQVRHPIVGDLLAHAQPVTDVVGSRSTVNARRFYERIRPWPHGLLVLGDALASYNPVYGHGLSVIAHSAQTIHHNLDRHGAHPSSTARIQRAIAGTANGAWTMATGQDVLYPDAVGRAPNPVERLLQRYVDRLIRVATSRPTAARALIDAFTLSTPMSRLVAPAPMFATLLGPRQPALTTPPLTDDERIRARPDPTQHDHS